MNADRKKTLPPPEDNPIRRQAIAYVTRQRFIIFLAAFIVTVCAVSMNLTHKQPLRVRGFTDIAAVLMWLMMFRLTARLHSLTGEKPTERERDREAEEMVKSWRPPS
jgi:uncharacterized membrane protein